MQGQNFESGYNVSAADSNATAKRRGYGGGVCGERGSEGGGVFSRGKIRGPRKKSDVKLRAT